MNKLKKIFITLCLLVLVTYHILPQALPSANPEDLDFSSKRLQRLTSVMQSYVDEHRLAGIVGLVIRRGSIVYQRSFGMADKESNEPMTHDTIFRIASMTKAITSVAVMILHEEGHFLLNNPVSRFIPEFKKPKVLVPDESKEGKSNHYKLVPAKREITIRDLLTHTSGIVYGFMDVKHLTDIYRKNRISDGLAQTEGTIGEMVRKLAKLPLKHHPGEHFTYGLNTDVLGYLVEVISGMPFDKFLQERIFTPLKMVDTHFFLPKNKVARLVSLYEPNPSGGIRKAGENEIKRGEVIYTTSYPYKGPGTYFSGGAGLVSTAQDYARFLLMILNKGKLNGVRILSRKTVELMTSNHIGHVDQGEDNFKFGLGFMIQNNPGETGFIVSEGSLSWGGIFHTSFWIDPKEELIGICLAQKYPAPKSDVHAKFQSLVYQAIID
jgi:CubicO group peptidase (beta-lactamase class C family)